MQRQEVGLPCGWVEALVRRVILNAMIYSAVIVNIDDADSSKGLLRLSGINNLSQIMVSRNLFFCYMLHYTNTFCYVQIS